MAEFKTITREWRLVKIFYFLQIYRSEKIWRYNNSGHSKYHGKMTWRSDCHFKLHWLNTWPSIARTVAGVIQINAFFHLSELVLLLCYVYKASKKTVHVLRSRQIVYLHILQGQLDDWIFFLTLILPSGEGSDYHSLAEVSLSPPKPISVWPKPS